MIELKELKREHLELARKWRNENKRFFFNQKYILEHEQIEWFENYLKKDTEKLYIVYINDNPVGTLGVSLLSKEKPYSVMIERVLIGDYKFERLGVMSSALNQLIANLEEDVDIFIEVQKDNDKAIKFYKKNKFVITEEKDDRTIMKYEKDKSA